MLYDGRSEMMEALTAIMERRIAERMAEQLRQAVIGYPAQATRDIRRNEIMNNPRNDVVVQEGAIGKIVEPGYRDNGDGTVDFFVQFEGLHYPHWFKGDDIQDVA